VQKKSSDMSLENEEKISVAPKRKKKSTVRI
jgi:hypothetical protein